MITLSKQHYKEILEHSVHHLPNEACGLLGGIIEDGIRKITKVYRLTNTDESPEHFSMDFKEQFQAIKDIRKNGWQLIGNFHSHPASAARPSDEDKRLAYDANLVYFIISLKEIMKPVLKSFLISGNNAEEVIIKFAEDDNG